MRDTDSWNKALAVPKAAEQEGADHHSRSRQPNAFHASTSNEEQFGHRALLANHRVHSVHRMRPHHLAELRHTLLCLVPGGGVSACIVHLHCHTGTFR